MAGLTQETIKLLDKLFNLKGESNIIIIGISENISDTQKSIEDTAEEQRNNEVNKVDCEGRLSVFNNQKEAFESVFEGLDDNAFAALGEIGINIEIGTMLDTISQKAPEFCERLNETIKNYQDAIEENKSRKSSLEEELSKLEDDKKKSEEDREKLISLLEQSLSPDDIERESLTANYVKKILSLFGVFSPEEISSLTKLIIFPDEGLYEYSESYEERLSNGLVGLDEVETASAYIQEEVDEHVQERSVDLTENETISLTSQGTEEIYGQEAEADSKEGDSYPEEPAFDLTRLNAAREELAEMAEIKPIISGFEFTEQPEVKDENPENTNESDLANFLSEIGLDLERFTIVNNISLEEISDILNNADRDLIVRNYELLRSINIYDDSIYKYYQNHLYLTDTDLSRKITILRAKGISESVIKSLIEDNKSSLRESFETIEKRINAIEEIDAKLTDENINQLSQDMEKYLENYKLLVNSGFELEEKELRNYSQVLLDSNNVSQDIEILKNYLISIVRKNGKYNLAVFWKTPYELITSVDDLIESDLEDLITSNSEALSQSSDEIIKRVLYCQEKGLPVVDEDNNYCDYITNYVKFNNEYGQNITLPELINRNSINNSLPDIIGNADFTEILVGALNNYYGDISSYENIDLEEATEKIELLKKQVTELLKATPTGKYTYKIGDVCISKVKIERHLTILLNALVQSGQAIDGVEKEILLTAALYNLRQDEETLRKVVSECLGFNQADAIGGKTI